MPPQERRYRIHIILNDTLVEDPAMAALTHLSLTRINAAAQAEAQAVHRRFPGQQAEVSPLFQAHRLCPPVQQRFWFLLLGLGYPAPTVKTRWCVDRLKLAPAETFIREHISRQGEVVITLGARESESTSRALSLRKRALPEQLLRRHSRIPGARVYTPIDDWEQDDVWIYLLQNESPWGDVNRDLAALYQSSSGECPLVTDRRTPSCAGSRFGCWTCTVVSQNRSLSNRVDEGEEWLIPLLQFRDHLMDTTNPEHKHLYRSLESRGSHLIQLNRQGQPSYRCYTLSTRKDLLRGLLQAQEQVRREGPDPQMTLVDFEELCAIRQVWRDEGDWEDSLPVIYREVTGRDEAWPVREDEQWMNAATKETLLYHCQHQHLPPQLVMELLTAMQRFQLAAAPPVATGTDGTEASITTLFEENPCQDAQQRALRTLLETVAALLRRDWREHDVRLAEVLARFAEEQQRQERQPTLHSLLEKENR